MIEAKAKILSALFAFIFSVSLAICFECGNAYAYTKSSEAEQAKEDLTNQLTETQQKINAANARIEECKQSLAELEDDNNDKQAEREQIEDKVNVFCSEDDEIPSKNYDAAFGVAGVKTRFGNDVIKSAMYVLQMRSVVKSDDDESLEAWASIGDSFQNTYKTSAFLYNDKQNEIKNLQNEVQELQASCTDIQNQISDADAQIASLKELEEKYSTAGDSVIVGYGIFCHPCPGCSGVSAPFAEERDGYSHKGIDFSASVGTPIYAAAEGTVIACANDGGDNGGMGNYVTIKHDDGLVSKYFHCQNVYVEAGTHVDKGQNIACVGLTGDTTGAHLHFQVEYNGTPIDPAPLIGL